MTKKTAAKKIGWTYDFETHRTTSLFTLTITVLRSRKTGHWYYRMTGANGEKMMHSETIKNRSYLKKLLSRFEAMGFVTVWEG